VSTKGQEADQSTHLCLRIKRDPEAIVSPVFMTSFSQRKKLMGA
jgi:hypothetical protein